MPTAPKAKTTAKAGAKAAAKRSTARRATAAKAGKSRVSKASPAGSRSAAVRRGPAGPTGAFGDYAERAILIPVGAALIARERVTTTVNDTVSIYSSTSKAQAQLRRFERRGATARNRLEREIRKARVRVERQLRQRRREIERTVSELDERRDAVTKNGTDLANRVPEFVTEVQERLLSLV